MKVGCDRSYALIYALATLKYPDSIYGGRRDAEDDLVQPAELCLQVSLFSMLSSLTVL